MKSGQILGSFIIVLILTAVAAGLYNSFAHKGGIMVMQVTDFETCAQAGNAVMESYPRQCRSTDGRLFVEEIPDRLVPPTEPFAGVTPGSGCAIGGCSAQLCGEEDDMDNLVSTCEYRAQYACYKKAACERQTNGKCGWTDTPVLQACISSADQSSEGSAGVIVY